MTQDPLRSLLGQNRGVVEIDETYVGGKAGKSYEGLDEHFRAHHAVDHGKQYVRAVILHTNFAESYHSLLKRGLIGAFHHVSEKHLPRYLNEFEFRWNSRKLSDGERTANAIRGTVGKRLVLRTPISH